MKVKKILITVGVLALFGLAFGAYSFFHAKDSNVETLNSYAKSNIESKIFTKNGTWGYDILIDGNLYIHQPSIPAIGGNVGFKTEEDARKTAELVISKIRNDMLPPSVSPEELKKLGVDTN